MKDCGCYICREGEPCEDRHPPEEIIRARRTSDGWLYWGERKDKARGRWVNICQFCADEISDDGEGIEAEMEAKFFTVPMIVINPGSGPVFKARVTNAEANIKVFADDLRERGIKVLTTRRKLKLDYGEGRYAFELKLEHENHKKTIEVQIPGLPIKDVRYLGTEDQNIWHYPRLYVDGSSWVWMYAIDASFPSEEDAE